MCEQCHKALAELNNTLDALIKLNRELLTHQRSQIPKLLSQARQYQLGVTNMTFTGHTQSQELLNVTAMLVQVSNPPGTLVIAERQIPINGQQLLYFGPKGMLIRPEDQITLTQNAAGLLSLELFGEQMADRGRRW